MDLTVLEFLIIILTLTFFWGVGFEMMVFQEVTIKFIYEVGSNSYYLSVAHYEIIAHN